MKLKAKHGSDTEAYTSTGEFDEKRFNYIFDMYSQPPHNALSFWEGIRMIHGNMDGFDPVSSSDSFIQRPPPLSAFSVRLVRSRF
jgi:peroxygenase